MILLDHIVLNSTNIENSVSFYKKVFGAKIENWQKYLDGEFKFPSVRMSETFIIDLFPKQMWQKSDDANDGKTANMNHFCLALDDQSWLRIKTLVEKDNIPLIRETGIYWGAQGDGMSFYIQDPDQNVIEIKKYNIED
jgi:extradiol dioxygenase family protein